MLSALRKLLGVSAIAGLAIAVAGAGTAQAEAAPGCSSTVQIGSTAHVTFQGQTIASVKQFKGCGKNWAYIYVWQQYASTHSDFTASAYIDAGTDPLGFNRGAKGQREVWSYGTNTLSICTKAGGDIVSPTVIAGAETDKRC